MEPTAFDILLGRSKQSFQHVGNQAFRALIAHNVDRYSSASAKRDKMAVVSSILDTIVDGGGRFLKEGHDKQWSAVNKGVARVKISHALRDHWAHRATKTQDASSDSGNMREPPTFMDWSHLMEASRGRSFWSALVLETLHQQSSESTAVRFGLDNTVQVPFESHSSSAHLNQAPKGDQTTESHSWTAPTQASMARSFETKCFSPDPSLSGWNLKDVTAEPSSSGVTSNLKQVPSQVESDFGTGTPRQEPPPSFEAPRRASNDWNLPIALNLSSEEPPSHGCGSSFEALRRASSDEWNLPIALNLGSEESPSSRSSSFEAARRASDDWNLPIALNPSPKSSKASLSKRRGSLSPSNMYLPRRSLELDKLSVLSHDYSAKQQQNNEPSSKSFISSTKTFEGVVNPQRGSTSAVACFPQSHTLDNGALRSSSFARKPNAKGTEVIGNPPGEATVQDATSPAPLATKNVQCLDEIDQLLIDLFATRKTHNDNG